MNWTPWIYDRMPEVGMYVQVEAKHDDTGEIGVQEGLVAVVTEDDFVWFLGETPNRDIPWTALRWRQLLDGHKYDVREREEEMV